MATSLYIHIPFCAAKCSYCSFASFAGLEGLHERYVDALSAEIGKCASVAAQVEPLRTVFFGGGTPTFLSGRLLKKILTGCSSHFSIAKDAEISIEANPGTVDVDKFTLLRNCGVTRVSLGVQSFSNQELKRIGRIHSANEAIRAVAAAREAGFTNVSLDLMYGLPQQSPESWQYSLETALSLGPQHLSLYQLTVEEETPLARLVENGTLKMPGDEAIAAMDEITLELTGAADLPQYEISNYARPGYQCRHNIGYWENREYFGLGAGAVSYLKGKRLRTTPDPLHYCNLLEEGSSVIVEEEVLDCEAAFRETVIMGLRMNEGVAVRGLQERYGIEYVSYYGDVLQLLVEGLLLEERSGFLRLTDQGRRFANRVMAELV
ncbi:MAG: radical SAM family heme chaperone HemW [Desulfocapsa sp.]|nr:radical SAM family heme chaperone HemW [Desulfocapsa sp.]